MKKSELKALIREVVEEVQENKLAQMIKALENSPELVKMAQEKYGSKLNEQDLTRRGFLKNLGLGLLGAGITAAMVNKVNASPPEFKQLDISKILRAIDKSREEDPSDIANRTPARPGSTVDIVRKAKDDPVFKELRTKYIDNISDDKNKADEYMKVSIVKAAKLLKTANDWEKNKDLLVSSVSIMTRFNKYDVRNVLEEIPEFERIIN